MYSKCLARSLVPHIQIHKKTAPKQQGMRFSPLALEQYHEVQSLHLPHVNLALLIAVPYKLSSTLESFHTSGWNGFWAFFLPAYTDWVSLLYGAQALPPSLLILVTPSCCELWGFKYFDPQNRLVTIKGILI